MILWANASVAPLSRTAMCPELAVMLALQLASAAELPRCDHRCSHPETARIGYHEVKATGGVVGGMRNVNSQWDVTKDKATALQVQIRNKGHPRIQWSISTKQLHEDNTWNAFPSALMKYGTGCDWEACHIKMSAFQSLYLWVSLWKLPPPNSPKIMTDFAYRGPVNLVMNLEQGTFPRCQDPKASQV